MGTAKAEQGTADRGLGVQVLGGLALFVALLVAVGVAYSALLIFAGAPFPNAVGEALGMLWRLLVPWGLFAVLGLIGVLALPYAGPLLDEERGKAKREAAEAKGREAALAQEVRELKGVVRALESQASSNLSEAREWADTARIVIRHALEEAKAVGIVIKPREGEGGSEPWEVALWTVTALRQELVTLRAAAPQGPSQEARAEAKAEAVWAKSLGDMVKALRAVALSSQRGVNPVRLALKLGLADIPLNQTKPQVRDDLRALAALVPYNPAIDEAIAAAQSLAQGPGKGSPPSPNGRGEGDGLAHSSEGLSLNGAVKGGGS